MKITEISVNRPAAVVMAIILIFGLGYLGYTSLGANLFPTVDIPVITIITTYPGAGVAEIQNDVIKPIEDQLAGLRGLDDMSSTANPGYALTVIRFTLETKMEAAFSDVNQAVSTAVRKLPKDASKPEIKKLDMNAEPIVTLTLTGDMPFDLLYDYADKTKTMIEKISGVGNVAIIGGQKKEVLIKIDKLKIDYYSVSIGSIVNKISSENMNIPAGDVEKASNSMSLRVLGEFNSLDEIKNTRIPTLTGSTVPLYEIAKVELEYPEKKQILRFNGEQTIAIMVQKQSDANIVTTTNTVRKKLDEYKEVIKDKVNISVAFDTSLFIQNTLREVNKNLLEGILTTAFVLFLFMRHIKSSLIVLIAIPTSLLGTFFMMYVFGFTLNLLTLLGLSLCIGILVDDSIVVIENIQRHMKTESDPIKAAIKGRNEIGMAAIAITLSDVVIFGPIAFVSGIIGQYFKEFGLTVVAAALFSLLVSFTITPMLAARFMKKKDIAGEDEVAKDSNQNAVHGSYGKISETYKRFLLWAMSHRWKTIMFIGTLVVASLSLLPLGMIPTEFTPASDQSFFSINISLNPGSDIKLTDEKAKIVETFLKSNGEIKDYLTNLGDSKSNKFVEGSSDPAKASIIAILKGKDSRHKSQSEIIKDVRSFCSNNLTGVDFSIVEPSYSGGNEGGKPVAVNIEGDEIDVLKDAATKLEDKMKAIPGVMDVASSIESSKGEINVKLDRTALNEYGLGLLDVSGTLRAAINGSNAGVFRKNGNDYDVVIKMEKGQIQDKYDLGSLKVISSAGKQVFLSDVAKIDVADMPMEQKRKNRKNVVMVSSNIIGRKLGDVNKDLEIVLADLKLPPGYTFSFGVEQKNMSDAFSSLIKALIASIALVYMILVVLYESYLTPFIRMLSLPCGIIGAIIAMAVTGTSMNVLTLIAIIMLDGLVSKNGTLLIDYTNTVMKTSGVSLKEALIISGTRRLRPIIMTSVTMIVGMLPSALSTGDGAEMKKGMAIILIGGILTSTVFSPILIPVVYTLIDDLKKKFSFKKHRKKVGEGL